MTLDRQQGFLSIIAILLVVIMSFIITAAVYQFTLDARTAANALNSAQAFYMAQTGLETAENILITNSGNCTSSINGVSSVTNATFTNAPGTFTVTGVATTASNTLAAILTANASSALLVSTTGFAAQGVINIDNEYINYSAISGNSLTGLTRGVMGSTATAHTLGAAVTQNQCVLNSVGSIPNASAPLGQRSVREILQGKEGFSLGTYGSGSLTPALVSLGGVSVLGTASITNSSVTASSANFPGSTILTNGGVVFNGSGNTEVSNGSGGLTVSSQSSNIESDVLENYSGITSSNLFGLYFNGQTKTQIMTAANPLYYVSANNGNNLNGVTGQTIWLDSYFNPSSGVTIGSAASPVILIINSNANLSSGVTIYGFVYVIQSLNMNGGSIIGAMATESVLNINGNNALISFNSTILNELNTINSNFGSSSGYLATPTSVQEIIP